MENNILPLSISDRLQFACNSKISCFNECCRDLNQFLTPYDVLRLRNNLSLSSSQFLEDYALEHTGPETGLLVVSLKPKKGKEMECPFVTPEGCSVYDDRPSSCRIYPLARMISRNRETGKITEHYALIREPHCLGFEGKVPSMTAAEWIKSQGLTRYNEMNDMMMEIISLKNTIKPGPLDLKEKQLFRLACYDIDRFRKNIFEEGLIDELGPDDKLLESIREDDEKLLKLGMKWIKMVLFAK